MGKIKAPSWLKPFSMQTLKNQKSLQNIHICIRIIGSWMQQSKSNKLCAFSFCQATLLCIGYLNPGVR